MIGRILRVVAPLLLGGVASIPACELATCVRHSDCGHAQVCVEGECSPRPIEGESEGSSGGTMDSGSSDGTSVPPRAGDSSTTDASQSTGSDDDTSGDTDPTGMSSAGDGTTSDGTTSDGTTSDGTTSDGTTSGGTTSDGTTSGGTTSGGTTSGVSPTGQDGGAVINDGGPVALILPEPGTGTL